MNEGWKATIGLGFLGAVGVAALTPPAAAVTTTPSGNSAFTTPQGQPAAEGQTSRGPNMLSAHSVAVLQEALDSTGEKIAINGVWGPATEAALKHYQQRYGLPVTGKLDQATRNVLDPIG